MAHKYICSVSNAYFTIIAWLFRLRNVGAGFGDGTVILFYEQFILSSHLVHCEEECVTTLTMKKEHK